MDKFHKNPHWQHLDVNKQTTINPEMQSATLVMVNATFKRHEWD